MGSYRAAGLIALVLSSEPAMAQVPGWQFSPLPGEGDRAALGCARDATPEVFTCLAVRCEDDFTIGVHVHSSRFSGDAGAWQMTLDRENKTALAVPSDGPYGARFVDDAAFLLDRLRYGTFIYLRHGEDEYAPFAFIDLSGSMRTIDEALYWCAPRVPEDEQNPVSGVDEAPQELEQNHEPSSPRPQ
ncbi:hypothetical protein VW35_13690 [Devosia soli]|uniref:Uncharacterized protein n=1 Tax=Devosia soli TaxID=361041 RepID=A0A0F5L7Y0_9HYPH|nr:hypothetical protein [Devosia soli]KKB77727.1 hypothetical protein VW35_13690 [Devosia soli]